jgi:hypothetical protein
MIFQAIEELFLAALLLALPTILATLAAAFWGMNSPG